MLSAVETDATLLANNSQHSLEMLRPFTRSFSLSNARINFIQLILTLLKLLKGGMGWGLSGPLLRFLMSCKEFVYWVHSECRYLDSSRSD